MGQLIPASARSQSEFSPEDLEIMQTAYDRACAATMVFVEDDRERVASAVFASFRDGVRVVEDLAQAGCEALARQAA